VLHIKRSPLSKVFEHTPHLYHEPSTEPSWTPRGGLNRDMGLLPSQQLVDLLEPTPCLAQLMVQHELASSLLGCISLLRLLGQPARTSTRRALGRTRSRPRATCMHGRASYRPPDRRPSSKSKITCRTVLFMSVATLLEAVPRLPARRRMSTTDPEPRLHCEGRGPRPRPLAR